MGERDWQAIMAGCERWLAPRAAPTAAQRLRAVADSLAPDAVPDRYGEGELVTGFEQHVASLLGHEAAVLMPSGTMAQQIALRVHCAERNTDTVAFHPTCHLEIHEHAGYAHLHGLKAELVSDRDRVIELADLEGLHARIGALLLELPQREIGGQLPAWDELVRQTEWARSRGVALHLDGARIWETTPFYDRRAAQIAGLFDTVYVSLYKGLGGLGGCILAGSDALIAEARVWRRRHGGTLPSLFMFAASARPALDHVPEAMPRYLAHARELAAALGALPSVIIVPDPPQTPLFHVHLRGESAAVVHRALDVAQESRVWLFHRAQPSALPGWSRVELTVGEPALEISPAEAAQLFERVLR